MEPISLELSKGRLSFSEYKQVFSKLKTWINANLPSSRVVFWNGSSNQQYVDLKNSLLSNFPLSSSVYQQLPKRVSYTLVFVDSNYNVYLGFTNNADIQVINTLLYDEDRIPILMSDNACMFAALSGDQISGAALIGNPSMTKSSASSLLSQAKSATFYRCISLSNSNNICGRTNIIQSFDSLSSKVHAYPNPPQVMAWTTLFTSYPYKWEDLSYVNSSGGHWPDACLCFNRNNNDYNLYGIIGRSSSNLWKITTYPVYKELLFISNLYNGLTQGLWNLIVANSNLYFQNNTASKIAPIGATWKTEMNTTVNSLSCNQLEGGSCSGGGTSTHVYSDTQTVQSSNAEEHMLVLSLKSDPQENTDGEILPCECCEGAPKDNSSKTTKVETNYLSSTGFVIAYVNDLNTNGFPNNETTGTNFVFVKTKKTDIDSNEGYSCDATDGYRTTTTRISYQYDSKNYFLFKVSLVMATIPYLNKSSVCFNKIFNKVLIALDELTNEFSRFGISLTSANTPPAAFVVTEAPVTHMSKANNNFMIPIGTPLTIGSNSISFERSNLDTISSCTSTSRSPDWVEHCECTPADSTAQSDCTPKDIVTEPSTISFSFSCTN